MLCSKQSQFLTTGKTCRNGGRRGINLVQVSWRQIVLCLLCQGGDVMSDRSDANVIKNYVKLRFSE
jgi:hypothetical protein